jgi:hypothetical protein
MIGLEHQEIVLGLSLRFSANIKVKFDNEDSKDAENLFIPGR